MHSFYTGLFPLLLIYNVYKSAIHLSDLNLQTSSTDVLKEMGLYMYVYIYIYIYTKERSFEVMTTLNI